MSFVQKYQETGEKLVGSGPEVGDFAASTEFYDSSPDIKSPEYLVNNIDPRRSSGGARHRFAENNPDSVPAGFNSIPQEIQGLF